MRKVSQRFRFIVNISAKWKPSERRCRSKWHAAAAAEKKRKKKKEGDERSEGRRRSFSSIYAGEWVECSTALIKTRTLHPRVFFQQPLPAAYGSSPYRLCSAGKWTRFKPQTQGSWGKPATTKFNCAQRHFYNDNKRLISIWAAVDDSINKTEWLVLNFIHFSLN